MQDESHIALDCPYCGSSIHETVGWFRKPYSTCPSCEKGIAAEQFAPALNDLEQAMDEEIDRMLSPEPERGGCGGQHGEGCGGHHDGGCGGH